MNHPSRLANNHRARHHISHEAAVHGVGVARCAMPTGGDVSLRPEAPHAAQRGARGTPPLPSVPYGRPHRDVSGGGEPPPLTAVPARPRTPAPPSAVADGHTPAAVTAITLRGAAPASSHPGQRRPRRTNRCGAPIGTVRGRPCRRHTARARGSGRAEAGP